MDTRGAWKYGLALCGPVSPGSKCSTEAVNIPCDEWSWPLDVPWEPCVGRANRAEKTSKARMQSGPRRMLG